MAALHTNIKDWLHKQQDWLQQAAELLLTNGGFNDADVAVLAERLKTPEGQAVSNVRPFIELSVGSVTADEVRLKSIGEIVGIENLGPRIPLDFGVGNLCVIYGNNGSGKSGYTRLIKKASGKPGAKEIKFNVFQSVPIARKAKIGFIHGAAAQEVEWQANGAPISALQSVDIFDSDAAITYLSRENEASYTPPLVTLFVRLVSVCERIKAKLQQQQDGLVSAKPQLPPGFAQTLTGKDYSALKAETAAKVIQQLTSWTNEDSLAIAQLEERLKAIDPATLASRKRHAKAQIEQIAGRLKSAATACSQAAMSHIRALRTDGQCKRKIAEEAGKVTSAQLDGVGSETWRALWESARKYSKQVAYKEKSFPVIVDSSRCVLCHQELDADAKKRLQDFESFVQGDVERAAEESVAAYRYALEHLPVLIGPEEIAMHCQAAGLIEESLVKEIRACWASISIFKQAMQNEELIEEAVPVIAPQALLDALKQRAVTLEEQANQHDVDAVSFNQAEAIRQKVELEARKWTAEQSAAIQDEVKRLRKVAEFEAWKKILSTASITNKGSEVAAAAITDAYVARFNHELQGLKASGIKIELVKTRAERGKALHRLRLKGAANANESLDQVLSEGERRIISLAAFLADVSEKPHASTFIFDDPISSLDQDFEIAVADRLVQLSKTRQVLVFTHRLSLYGALDDASKKMGEEWKKKNLEQRCIETYSNVSGSPVSQPIWASRTDAANNDLLSRLAAAKKAGDAAGSEAYRALAQGICTDFRRLLERTVEADLLNGIVIRHRRSVTTDNLLSRLPNITVDDCKFIDDLMTRFSGFEHSQSTEVVIQVPEEPNLKKDIEALREWRDRFKKRPVTGVANA